MDVTRSDVIVIGSGVAGLAAALGLRDRSVILLTKTRLRVGGSSPWAQGGIAAAVGEDDSPRLHAADTIAAGHGLSDPRVVRMMTTAAPDRIRRLIELGAAFDRDPAGGIALGREAAHSRRRILHAFGDTTGAELIRALTDAACAQEGLDLREERFAVDLLAGDAARSVRRADGNGGPLDGNGRRLAGGGRRGAADRARVTGVLAREPDGRMMLYVADAVIIASGGLGHLYLHTTNPPEATGDGLAMAARAGARLADLEFVQFHPTALAVGADPMPLLTEALRGEGALLVDDAGVDFMADEHPDGCLAPRDVVARAIRRREREGHRVFLDARAAIGDAFPERFPTAFSICRRHGLDPRREAVPVSPAAHYHIGGIAVDERGRSSLPGLWACGEAAATGVHGANRLASNSLLEALVFGARVADDVRGSTGDRGSETNRGSRTLALAGPPGPPAVASAPASGSGEVRRRIRKLMWERVGLERDEHGLRRAADELRGLADAMAPYAGPMTPGAPDAAAMAPGAPAGPDTMPEPAIEDFETRNMIEAARLVASAALARRESRGVHFRSDYARARPEWKRRLFRSSHVARGDDRRTVPGPAAAPRGGGEAASPAEGRGTARAG